MVNRDDALKICETVLDHAKAAGADDAQVSLDNSVESHARFADNRITTSGRSDDVDITATVWVGRRRGAATVNDTSAAALKLLATDAVQIARLSPVQREYVPTLGPANLPRGPWVFGGHRQHRRHRARQDPAGDPRRVPRPEDHRRRLSHGASVGERDRNRQRQSPLLSFNPRGPQCHRPNT